MQGKHVLATFHIPGTLAADVIMVWTAPFACQLVKVSAVGSNANDATLTIGTTAVVAAYMAETAIGDSYVPAVFDQDDFVDGQFPHIPAGTIVRFDLDYNGAAGTAVDDATIVAAFTEG
jgi:hypothetical protein